MVLANPGCTRGERGPSPGLRISSPVTLFSFGRPVSAAVCLGGERFAAGTTAGEVMTLTRQQAPQRLRLAPTPGAQAPEGRQALHDGQVSALAPWRRGVLSVGGHQVGAWDTAKGQLYREVRGPQQVTALAPEEGGRGAFFGTEQGHVLRWDLDKGSAMPVAGFTCGGAQVPPVRLQLPPDRRCPFGTHRVLDDGRAVCLYPVTNLLTHGGVLLRACRQGTLGKLQLQTRKLGWASAGHLRVLAAAGPGRVLLGREDGRLELYAPGTGEVFRKLRPGGPPPLAAHHAGSLLAVATAREVLLWEDASARPLARIMTPRPALAVSLREDGAAITLVLQDGAVVSHTLTRPPARGP